MGTVVKLSYNLKVIHFPYYNDYLRVFFRYINIKLPSRTQLKQLNFILQREVLHAVSMLLSYNFSVSDYDLRSH